MTGGYEHHWNPAWKTSLYGAYGAVKYATAASAAHCRSVRPVVSDWSYTQIGSRTVWTPVKNLDLSVEVMYNNLNTAYDTTAGYADKSWVSGMFRAQRNFWP